MDEAQLDAALAGGKAAHEDKEAEAEAHAAAVERAAAFARASTAVAV